MPDPNRFRKDVQHLINCCSLENGSNSPDFILAQYLDDCLTTFDRAVNAREIWYGRRPGSLNDAPPPHPVTAWDVPLQQIPCTRCKGFWPGCGCACES